MAGARGGAEEGRDRAPSAGRATRDRCCGWPTRTASRRTSGSRARRTCISPTSASSTSIPSEDQTGRPACRGARAARTARRTGPDKLGEDSGSKGFHIVVPLDGEARLSGRSRGLPTPPARCWSSAIRSASRRSSARWIAADASWWIPDATPTARRSRRLMPCARSRARRSRRRAPGKKSRAARSGRRTFTLRNMAARIAEAGDLWSDIIDSRQSLRRRGGAVARDNGEAQ